MACWAPAARRKASVNRPTRVRWSSFSFDASRIMASAANSAGALRAKAATLLESELPAAPRQYQGKKEQCGSLHGFGQVLFILDATGLPKDGGPTQLPPAVEAALDNSFVVPPQMLLTDGMKIPRIATQPRTKRAKMSVYSTRSCACSAHQNCCRRNQVHTIASRFITTPDMHRVQANSTIDSTEGPTESIDFIQKITWVANG